MVKGLAHHSLNQQLKVLSSSKWRAIGHILLALRECLSFPGLVSLLAVTVSTLLRTCSKGSFSLGCRSTCNLVLVLNCEAIPNQSLSSQLNFGLEHLGHG